MNDYSPIFAVIGLLIIAAFSVLAARAEEAFWSKCRRRDSCLRTQQEITLGKSRTR
jgi:hypothetical protein